MFRSFLIVTATLSLTAWAHGQTRPVQWISNVNQGVAQARRAGLPIMFYVTGSGRGDGGDLEDAQQVTFRDPLVVGIAAERFVPIRLARSTQTKELLGQLGAPTEHGHYVLFVTPEMKPLGTVQPGQIADTRAMARQMTTAFRAFRTDVFERELKPTLENKEARPGDVIKALKQIEKLLIVEADQSVVRLVQEGGLSTNVTKKAYDVLAVLSTPAGTQALLAAAPNDKLAERALGRCQEGVAEALLPALESENFEEFIIAYEALVKICKLGRAKSRGFWGGKNERLINEELERVKQAATAKARRWKQTYEPYR
jgi:hypothetical protein